VFLVGSFIFSSFADDDFALYAKGCKSIDALIQIYFRTKKGGKNPAFLVP
jgi:hypothetical protein